VRFLLIINLCVCVLCENLLTNNAASWDLFNHRYLLGRQPVVLTSFDPTWNDALTWVRCFVCEFLLHYYSFGVVSITTFDILLIIDKS
jgi:hypothetical protein